MTKNIEKRIRSVLQFLALSDQAKISYLPSANANGVFVVNECGLESDNPLFCYAYASWELLESAAGTYGHKTLSEILSEIHSLLSVMIEQRDAYPYVWVIGADMRISGPADALWRILARLSKEAITLANWTATMPELSFEEMLKS